MISSFILSIILIKFSCYIQLILMARHLDPTNWQNIFIDYRMDYPTNFIHPRSEHSQTLDAIKSGSGYDNLICNF